MKKFILRIRRYLWQNARKKECFYYNKGYKYAVNVIKTNGFVVPKLLSCISEYRGHWQQNCFSDGVKAAIAAHNEKFK